jgi:CHAT domain-containing protein/tetratricopeptide (TPR) repeat protein
MDESFNSATARIGASLVVIALIGVVLVWRCDTQEDSIADLLAASQQSHRTFEPRLAGGFAWTPFDRSGARDLRLMSAAGSTLARYRGVSSSTARHTTGIAHLLSGRPRQALESLSEAATAAGDAPVWNDLAVALYETSVQYDAPELLGDALAAADHALALNAELEEAAFNRALILERLGLRECARKAWERFLARDATSGWAREAQQRLDALKPEIPFVQRLDAVFDDIVRNPATAEVFVRIDPQDARTRAATELFSRWARRAPPDRDRALVVARAISVAVSRLNGDRLFERAVAAIDRAIASGENARRTLASAHLDYQSAVAAFQDNRPGDAEPLFRRAAAAFERVGSPVSLQARYLAANTVFEQGRTAEARTALEVLLTAVPADFMGLRAQLLWQLGSVHAGEAAWGDSIAALRQSATIFHQLGERRYAGSVHGLLAFAYERLGDPESAWNHRMVALQSVGGTSTLALEKSIGSIAEGAMLRKNWAVAESFFSLKIDIARSIGDDVQLADAILLRAAIRRRAGNVSGAHADAADGRAAVARIQDPAYHQYLLTAELRTRAVLTHSPADAVALLTHAIAFQTTNDVMDLPGLYLQRAQARRASGDADGAWSDLQRGIEALESHRRSLPVGEMRWGAFHAAEDLFDEAIDLAIDEEQIDRAFVIAERSRARALLEAYGRAPTLDSRALPAGTVLVEYVTLPSRLVIFTADTTGVQAVVIETTRAPIESAIRDAVQAFREDRQDAARRTARVLHERLVQPVEARFTGRSTIVFIPDNTTATVPFSALVNRDGQYLIEHHIIVVAPSAAAYAAASQRRDSMAVPRSVLVVANSAPGGGGRLAFVNREADAVAAPYATSVRLGDDAATFEELRKHAPAADVLHFAGHAIGDGSGLAPASILLRRNTMEERADAGEIARLQLQPWAIVVLAGCSTARGERRAAEGVISIAHAFLSAGASSVIATLWPIADEAAWRFFSLVHEGLAAGFSPAEALRNVQLESIRRGDVPLSLWSGVQDIGS